MHSFHAMSLGIKCTPKNAPCTEDTSRGMSLRNTVNCAHKHEHISTQFKTIPLFGLETALISKADWPFFSKRNTRVAEQAKLRVRIERLGRLSTFPLIKQKITNRSVCWGKFGPRFRHKLVHCIAGCSKMCFPMMFLQQRRFTTEDPQRRRKSTKWIRLTFRKFIT